MMLLVLLLLLLLLFLAAATADEVADAQPLHDEEQEDQR
jgi:cytochrome c-type biogenesis protein CcmH/NrfF